MWYRACRLSQLLCSPHQWLHGRQRYPAVSDCPGRVKQATLAGKAGKGQTIEIATSSQMQDRGTCFTASGSRRQGCPLAKAYNKSVESAGRWPKLFLVLLRPVCVTRCSWVARCWHVK